LKLIKSILSAKPGRYLVLSQPQETLISLVKLHADLIGRLCAETSIHKSDPDKRQLLSAYGKGHQLRLEWLAKRLHKSRVRPPPELEQLELSLQAMITCLIES
jgi:hypothetical protein